MVRFYSGGVDLKSTTFGGLLLYLLNIPKVKNWEGGKDPNFSAIPQEVRDSLVDGKLDVNMLRSKMKRSRVKLTPEEKEERGREIQAIFSGAGRGIGV